MNIKIENGQFGHDHQNDDQQQQQMCQICGDISDSNHFGASACRACAAFFRRTVAKGLRYACRFEDSCDFSKSCRAMCKACRLKKCLQVGMDSNSVRSRPNERPKGTKGIARAKSKNEIPSGIPLDSAASIASSMVLPPSDPSHHQNVSSIEGGEAFILHELGPMKMGKKSTMAENKLAGHSLINSMANENAQMLLTPSSSVQMEIGFGNSTRGPIGKSVVLEEIVRLKEGINIQEGLDGQLPNEFPKLAKILVGYSRLERQRDIRYNRLRESPDGAKIRMFAEKQMFDLYAYWQNLQNEVEWMADMLLYFGQYQQLQLADKLNLFRNFWILFIILERSYDTFNVLNGSEEAEDPRMVFANGEIFDMNKCEYDYKRIGNAQMYKKLELGQKIDCPLKPWFSRSTRELMPLFRRLRPQPIEIAFCFALMFWRVPVEIAPKLSPEAAEIGRTMVENVYQELAQFYAKEMPMENPVKRVAELCRIISITEILALQRKEEMILARTFQAFKVDLYMEEVFGCA